VTVNRGFTSPLFSLKTLDTYWSRRQILSAISVQMHNFHGTLLDIGCGRMPYKPLVTAPPSRVDHYIGLDLRADLISESYSRFGPPDLMWDGRTIPMESCSVDCTIATEVFEQCHDVEAVMCEAYRVLKPGGLLFFTVPFLWPLHDFGLDQYRFTPSALERHLKAAGFEGIDLQSLGGWDASLGQLIGLWVRRRKMNRFVRNLFSALAMPIMYCLFKVDSTPPVFTDQTMITGITGIAVKPLNKDMDGCR
jgi:SAM-dependent methyltransferase